jgi:hypothetical protein
VAIWHLENSAVTMNAGMSSALENSLYRTYTTNVGTGHVSDFLWITPGNNCGQVFQEQVGSVPEPPSIILLGLGLAALAVLRRKPGAAYARLCSR